MTRRRPVFTFVELLFLVAVFGVLAALSLPAINVGFVYSQQTQVLSNMKQLHMATQQMALDGTSTGDTNIGWPGDMGGTATNWEAQLLKGNYLSTNDVIKLLSVPPENPSKPTLRERWNAWRTGPRSLPTGNNEAVLLYAVTETSDGKAVFLSTANFTNTPSGGVYNGALKTLKNPGFVVFHKAGDGVILAPRQVGETNVIGSYVPVCK